MSRPLNSAEKPSRSSLSNDLGLVQLKNQRFIQFVPYQQDHFYSSRQGPRKSVELSARKLAKVLDIKKTQINVTKSVKLETMPRIRTPEKTALSLNQFEQLVRAKQQQSGISKLLGRFRYEQRQSDKVLNSQHTQTFQEGKQLDNLPSTFHGTLSNSSLPEQKFRPIQTTRVSDNLERLTKTNPYRNNSTVAFEKETNGPPDQFSSSNLFKPSTTMSKSPTRTRKRNSSVQPEVNSLQQTQRHWDSNFFCTERQTISLHKALSNIRNLPKNQVFSSQNISLQKKMDSVFKLQRKNQVLQSRETTATEQLIPQSRMAVRKVSQPLTSRTDQSEETDLDSFQIDKKSPIKFVKPSSSHIEAQTFSKKTSDKPETAAKPQYHRYGQTLSDDSESSELHKDPYQQDKELLRMCVQRAETPNPSRVNSAECRKRFDAWFEKNKDSVEKMSEEQLKLESRIRKLKNEESTDDIVVRIFKTAIDKITATEHLEKMVQQNPKNILLNPRCILQEPKEKPELCAVEQEADTTSELSVCSICSDCNKEEYRNARLADRRFMPRVAIEKHLLYYERFKDIDHIAELAEIIPRSDKFFRAKARLDYAIHIAAWDRSVENAKFAEASDPWDYELRQLKREQDSKKEIYRETVRKTASSQKQGLEIEADSRKNLINKIFKLELLKQANQVSAQSDERFQILDKIKTLTRINKKNQKLPDVDSSQKLIKDSLVNYQKRIQVRQLRIDRKLSKIMLDHMHDQFSNILMDTKEKDPRFQLAIQASQRRLYGELGNDVLFALTFLLIRKLKNQTRVENKSSQLEMITEMLEDFVTEEVRNRLMATAYFKYNKKKKPDETSEEEEIKTPVLHKRVRHRLPSRMNSLSIRHIAKLSKDNEKERDLVSKAVEKKALNIIQQVKFQRVANTGLTQCAEAYLIDDTHYIFQNSLKGELEAMLPIPTKIADGKLILNDYTLSIGQCQALAKVFVKEQETFNTLYLNNCGVDDGEFASLLKGLKSGDNFKMLEYKLNMLGEASMPLLKTILNKKPPTHLLHLRLSKCRTSQALVEELTMHLSAKTSYLKSLGLVRMQLTFKSIGNLANLLRKTVYLDDLDISWNELPYHAFMPLLDAISRNKRLCSLNLSYNTLIDAAEQTVVAGRNKSSLHEKLIGQVVTSSYPDFVAHSLGQFIRFNNNLKHLDLTNTGLSSFVFYQLAPYLRRAKSLLSLHASGNPGVDKQVKQFYKERLKIERFKQRNHVEIARKLECFTLKNITDKSQLEKDLEHKLFLESVTLSHIKNTRRLFSYQDIQVSDTSNHMVLTRILGHQLDLPGRGQWSFQQGNADCWVCNFHKYSLLFWNPFIGKTNEQEEIQLVERQMNILVKQIEALNKEDIEESEKTGIPLFFSEQTNWKASKFVNLLDFVLMYSVKPQNLESSAEKFVIATVEEVFGEDDDRRIARQHKIKHLIAEKQKDLYNEYLDKQRAQWMTILKSRMRYAHPNFLQHNQVSLNDFDNTFVLTSFFKPGKQQVFYYAPKSLLRSFGMENRKTQFFYQRYLIEARTEEIPQFKKQLRVQKTTIQFDLSHSVFKAYAEDNELLAKKAIKHDSFFWKIQKLCKKDELESVEAAILDTWPLVNDVFKILIDGPDYPAIGKAEFESFCNTANIIDETCTRTMLDTFFREANYELIQQETNSKSSLVRYEYFEMLFRIARGKYLETGRCRTLSEAYKKLVKDNILRSREALPKIEIFRSQQLWTLEVNNLLFVNLKPIQKIFNNLLQRSAKEISVEQAIQFVETFPEEFEVSLEKVMRCFRHSKQSVLLENLVDGESQLQKYFEMNGAEFLEFLARLADAKFQNSNEDAMTLSEKLSSMLEVLLPTVDAKLVVPDSVKQDQSLSDDDY